ncbi:Protein RER1B [Hibiscus syriacus]|uniref:Protein RER1B n=1 Tax=Hibiscus syriacus TaxID=106335 RepID=A0A6A2XJV7_HIBSY|nr:Protein RER1B [Hibiscus syriacus]
MCVIAAVAGSSNKVNMVAPNFVHSKSEWTSSGIALLIGKHKENNFRKHLCPHEHLKDHDHKPSRVKIVALPTFDLCFASASEKALMESCCLTLKANPRLVNVRKSSFNNGDNAFLGERTRGSLDNSLWINHVDHKKEMKIKTGSSAILTSNNRREAKAMFGYRLCNNVDTIDENSTPRMWLRSYWEEVLIGGCYKLIDIPMSNCFNSGINKIFVLMQFNSASLNRHLAQTYYGNGINFGDGFVEDAKNRNIENVVILCAIISIEWIRWTFYRYSMTKAFCIAFVMTFFSLFDVPVFCPILLCNWIVLFALTMRRQIAHMIEYKYIPFNIGKQYSGKKASASTVVPVGIKTCVGRFTGKVAGDFVGRKEKLAFLVTSQKRNIVAYTQWL